MEKIVVIGGGITGHIIQHFIKNAIILDDKPVGSPQTFSMGANYLWKPISGFECQRMNIRTTVDGVAATPTSIKRYKNKIGKGYENAEDCLEQFKEFTFGWKILKFPEASIWSDCKVVSVNLSLKTISFQNMVTEQVKEIHYSTLFSTIPLPMLLDLSGLSNKYPTDTLFKCTPIYVRITHAKDSSAIVPGSLRVDYISDPLENTYRVTHKGSGEIHHESLVSLPPKCRVIHPGKIYEDSTGSVSRIVEDLALKGVYTVGRFGRWQSNELVHDTYENVREIAERIKV